MFVFVHWFSYLCILCRLLLSPYFQFPEFYSFPPFFTIQPVLASREKQLALWRELILRYHTENKIKTLVVVRIG